jgi:hypothetical protein
LAARNWFWLNQGRISAGDIAILKKEPKISKKWLKSRKVGFELPCSFLFFFTFCLRTFIIWGGY